MQRFNLLEELLKHFGRAHKFNLCSYPKPPLPLCEFVHKDGCDLPVHWRVSFFVKINYIFVFLPDCFIYSWLVSKT